MLRWQVSIYFLPAVYSLFAIIACFYLIAAASFHASFIRHSFRDGGDSRVTLSRLKSNALSTLVNWNSCIHPYPPLLFPIRILLFLSTVTIALIYVLVSVYDSEMGVCVCMMRQPRITLI